MTMHCAGGVCSAFCDTGKDVCRDFTMECGPRDSIVTCNNGEDAQTVVPPPDGSNCACETVDC
jgi:hypothetical protein